MDRRYGNDAPVGEGRLDDERDVPVRDDGTPVPRQRDDMPADGTRDGVLDERDAGTVPHDGPGPVHHDPADPPRDDLPQDTPGEVRQEVEPDPAHSVPAADRDTWPDSTPTRPDPTRDDVLVAGTPTPPQTVTPAAEPVGTSPVDPVETSPEPVGTPPGEHKEQTLSGRDLFGTDTADVQRRWHDVQAGFVDDPRAAVERADGLLDEVVTAMTQALASRTGGLQEQWKNAEKHDTEQLRLALREYRTVLERLLHLSDDETR